MCPTLAIVGRSFPCYRRKSRQEKYFNLRMCVKLFDSCMHPSSAQTALRPRKKHESGFSLRSRRYECQYCARYHESIAR